jgi:hypothetical protein
MKNFIKIFPCLLLFVAANCFALPPGNYRQSCANCNYIAGNLSCLCKTRKGFSRMSFLQGANRCPFIQNMNGRLVCTHRPGPQKPLPSGSYRHSCRACYMRGRWLSCLCRRQYGGWQRSQLRITRWCHRHIKNKNGQLICGIPPWRRLPRGNYKHTCRRCEYDGWNLHCQCQRRNQTWRWTRMQNANSCPFIQNINGHLRCR